jgi:hypothetical protein
LEGLEGWDLLFITDINSRVPPPKGFDVVQAELFTHGKFNYSRCRNASMAYAKEHGYDWLIQANPDIVMLQPPRSFPETGISSVMTYHTKASDDVSAVVREWRVMGSLEFLPTSYFIMNASIFTQYRFCEDFYGYGYDDMDFLSNVLWRDGISRMDGTQFGAKAIHVYYPDNIWGNSGPDMERNRSLFEQRLAYTRFITRG